MSLDIQSPPRLLRVSNRMVPKASRRGKTLRKEARRQRRLRKLRELDIHMMYMMLHDSTGAPIGLEEDQPRPVRVFGVINENRDARKAFVWEIDAENAPLKLSPEISHLVDLGTSCIYVFHGDESGYPERRLAAQIAKSYANHVEDYPSVVEVWCTLRAKCFFSGCRGYIARIKELAFDGDALSEEGAPAAAVGASEGDASSNKNGALFEDGTRTAAGRSSWGWFDNSRGRTSLAVASAIGVIGVIATMAVVSRRR